jgi:osmotically-inducible protein OsmY
MPNISEYALSTLPLRIQEGPEWHKSDVSEAVGERLRESSALEGYTDSIDVELDDGTLLLTGQLPSFYLKQVLQSVLRGIPGVLHIDNRVEVADRYGFFCVFPPCRELVHD